MKLSFLLISLLATNVWGSISQSEEEIKYDLYVLGKQVTSLNCGAVLGDSTVKYEAATKTLILEGAQLFYANGPVIKTSQDLIIESFGINSVSSIDPTTGCGIQNDGGTTTFKGPGYTIVTSVSNCAIDAKKDLIKQGSGIVMFQLKDGDAIRLNKQSLIVEEGNFSVSGRIVDCHNLVLKGTMLVSNTIYDATTHQFLNRDDKQEATSIMIAEGSTGIDQLIDSPNKKFTKILKDGQLLILREGKVYSVTGCRL